MKILVQPYTQVLSHTIRPLLVARELRRRGHDVVFGSGNRKRQFIERDGFDILPMYEPDVNILWNNIRQGRMRFLEADELDRMVDADLAIYREFEPDLVLTDFRFTAPISTQLHPTRHAAIVNASSTEYRALPFIPLFDWVPPWLVKRDCSVWKAMEKLNIQIEKAVFDNVMAYFRKVSRRRRLARTVTATNCLTGNDVTLLADIPEYFPTDNLPDSYRYIGPLVWNDPTAPPNWWPPRSGGRPLVYITMGTTGVADFLRKAAELCAGAGLMAIVTTGGQANEIRPIEGQVIVEDYLDGNMVMDACDLAVCHGGNGTINQALLHGKPIIGIPNTPDGRFNMRRVEALGVGKMITLRAFWANPGILTATISHIVGDTGYYDRASHLRKRLEHYKATEAGADIIEGKA